MFLRRIALATALLLALAATGAGLWVYVADRIESGIARWAEMRRAEGWRIGHAGLTIDGFPLHWRARIEKPTMTAPGPSAATWTAPVLFVEHAPWHPRRVRVEAPGLHRVDWAGGMAVELGTTRATALLHLDEKGDIQRVETVLDEVTIVPAGSVAMRAQRIEAEVGPGSTGPENGPQPRQTAFAVRAEVFGLILPEGPALALGRTVNRIAVNAAVLGPLSGGQLPDMLAAWRDAGGTLEIAKLALGWGPLSATGDGTIALDSRLQPIGAMTARLAGFEETLETLVDAGVVQAKHGGLVNFALNAMAKRPADGGAPYIEAPVTIQNSRLFIGPVALVPLPRINWSALDR